MSDIPFLPFDNARPFNSKVIDRKPIEKRLDDNGSFYFVVTDTIERSYTEYEIDREKEIIIENIAFEQTRDSQKIINDLFGIVSKIDVAKE